MTAAAAVDLAAELLLACRHDPIRFVRTMYPWGEPGTALENEQGPREWQLEVLAQIQEHLTSPRRFEPLKIAISSGHGIGKSALMAWVNQWAICTEPEARGVVTANTENQLRTKTWPEMQKWYALLAVRDLFKLDKTVFRSSDPRYEDTWRSDATPWSEANTEAFAGLHNKGRRILLEFDEGSAISDVIYEVSEGALTDEKTEIIWLVMGNPTRPQGRFFQCFNLHRHRWLYRQIDARDIPGTNKRQLDEWVEDYGEDSDFVRVRVRGMFPRTGSNQLIPTEVVTEAQSRDDSPRLTDPLIFGVDVARFGDDQSVLYVRKGVSASVFGPYKWRGLDNVELAREIADKMIELDPDYVFIDGGGPGGGVVDILRHRGFDVTEVNFGGKAQNPDHANKRAEIWVRMRDWLAGGGCIPWDDQDLASDLINQTYSYQEGRANALILTPKARMKADGLPSPDSADALALTFAEPVAPKAKMDGLPRSVDVGRTEYDTGW